MGYPLEKEQHFLIACNRIVEQRNGWHILDIHAFKYFVYAVKDIVQILGLTGKTCLLVVMVVVMLKNFWHSTMYNSI